MKLRNLEDELDQICDQQLWDVESAIMRYGHGDCHDLTLALIDTYGFEAVAIVGKDSGFPVHSCVLMEEGITLDAYGVNTLEATVARYAPLCRLHLEEDAEIRPVDADWLASISWGMVDPAAHLAEFQAVLDYIGLELSRDCQPQRDVQAPSL